MNVQPREGYRSATTHIEVEVEARGSADDVSGRIPIDTQICHGLCHAGHIRRRVFFSLGHQVVENENISRELAAYDATRIHRGVHIDIVLGWVIHKPRQGGQSIGAGAVDFNDAEDVSPGHASDRAIGPIDTRIDHNRAIDAGITIVDMEAGNRDRTEESIIHIKGDDPGSNRSSLRISLDLNLNPCSA